MDRALMVRLLSVWDFQSPHTCADSSGQFPPTDPNHAHQVDGSPNRSPLCPWEGMLASAGIFVTAAKKLAFSGGSPLCCLTLIRQLKHHTASAGYFQPQTAWFKTEQADERETDDLHINQSHSFCAISKWHANACSADFVTKLYVWDTEFTLWSMTLAHLNGFVWWGEKNRILPDLLISTLYFAVLFPLSYIHKGQWHDAHL